MQLEKDLKGASIQDKLKLNDPVEQFQFKSYFHWSDDISKTNPPFIAANNDWIIRQTIADNDAKIANASALSRLNEGASGIGFTCVDNLSERLKSIESSYIYTDFTIKNSEEADNILKQLPEAKNTTFSFDPVLDEKFDLIAPYFETIVKEKGFCAFEIDNSIFASAGANITQQLGIAIAQINEYLHTLTEKGYSVDKIISHIQLKLGIGQNFIYEIAKFRAIRVLIQNLAKVYDRNADGTIKIHAESIALNKSLEDPYTNLLRLTTEGMSAAMGGIDIISLLPYDFWSIKGASDFAYRVSTNIAHILKEEANFNIVTDPSNGAYAIESATNIIAENAWAFFKTIEAKGGFSKALETKFIQENIREISKKRIEQFQSKEKKYIGINVYENPKPETKKWNLSAFSNKIEPLILELHKTEGGKL